MENRKQAKGDMYAHMQWFLETLLRSLPASRCWGIVLGLLLCLSCYAAAGEVAKHGPSQEGSQRDERQARTSITVAGGRLSVNLRQAELQEVLSRIGQKVGFSLRMASTTGETINAQFTDMALIPGLRRLLRLASLSYAMVYDAQGGTGGGLKELWVFGTGRGGAPDLPRVVADQEDADARAPKISNLEVLTSVQSQGGQRAEPPTSPQANSLLNALNGQRPEMSAPLQPSPLLDALNGQRPERGAPPQPTAIPDDPSKQEQPPDDQQPEVAPPSPPHPFLSLNPR